MVRHHLRLRTTYDVLLAPHHMLQACRFYGGNPWYGTISFDNILAAWVTIFQCVTLEGWTDVLYATSRPAGIGAGFFFVALTYLLLAAH